MTLARLTGAVRCRAPELAAALAGFGWFLAVGGWRALPPTSLDWLGHARARWGALRAA